MRITGPFWSMSGSDGLHVTCRTHLKPLLQFAHAHLRLPIAFMTPTLPHAVSRRMDRCIPRIAVAAQPVASRQSRYMSTWRGCTEWIWFRQYLMGNLYVNPRDGLHGFTCRRKSDCLCICEVEGCKVGIPRMDGQWRLNRLCPQVTSCQSGISGDH